MATADNETLEQARVEETGAGSTSTGPPAPEQLPEQQRSAWAGERRPPVFAGGDGRDDVGLQVRHLKIDDLTLELQASVGIDRVGLESKGLEAELYLQANLENVVALVDSAARRTPTIVDSVAHTAGTPTSDEQAETGVRNQKVVGEGAPDAGASSESQEDGGAGESDAQATSPGERAKQLARSPAAAATAAVAGAALGALANAKHDNHSGIASKLPGRRDRSVLGELRERVVGQLRERAAEAPGDVVRAVRRRLH